jgi:hypothetical protein
MNLSKNWIILIKKSYSFKLESIVQKLIRSNQNLLSDQLLTNNK